uniref:SH2 domain-containing protein n=1 Tax=Meloidogyne hapla TaxID=6305 RepID=A0A1I8AYD0_MELHA
MLQEALNNVHKWSTAWSLHIAPDKSTFIRIGIQKNTYSYHIGETEITQSNADVVLDYLLTHPGFLESFVTGPQISAETFQRWTLKRNNKLRRDSRRQLLSGFSDEVNSINSSSTNAGASDDLPSIIGGGIFNTINNTDNNVSTNNNSSPNNWLSVIRSDDEAGTIKLRKVRKQRKPP